MPRIEALRVFDKNLTVLGYVLPAVARFAVPEGVRPGYEWTVNLYPGYSPHDPLPDLKADSTFEVKKAVFTFDQTVFYGPGKYVGAVPDAHLNNLILLEGPEELWQAQGWMKRHEPDEQCTTEIH